MKYGCAVTYLATPLLIHIQVVTHLGYYNDGTINILVQIYRGDIFALLCISSG